MKQSETQSPGSLRRMVSRRRKPKLKLYEVSALVNYHSVILAASEKDALEHVATWEQAWHENAALIGVSDVQITDTRPLKASDWKDAAHDRTCKAANIALSDKPAARTV